MALKSIRTDDKGNYNSAIKAPWTPGQKYNEGTFTPTIGTVITTDQGGTWQITGISSWVYNAWAAEASMTDAQYDGIKIVQTGKVMRRDSHDLGLAVRVEITFVGYCEPDTVTRGWMKVS